MAGEVAKRFNLAPAMRTAVGSALAVVLLLLAAMAGIGSALRATDAPLALLASATPLDAVKKIEADLGAAKSNISKNGTNALALLDSGSLTYVSDIQPSAKARDPLTDAWIVASFGRLEERVRLNDSTGFGVEAQSVKKLDYRVAYLQMWHELNVTKDAVAARTWFDVLSWKFKWAPGNKAFDAMENITKDASRLDSLKGVVSDGTIDQFASKVIEEGTEAKGFLTTNHAKAREVAAEGRAYFAAIQEDVEAKVGKETRYAIEGYLEQVVRAVDAKDAAALASAVDGYQALVNYFLTGYRPGDFAGTAHRVAQLMELVKQEYEAAVPLEGGKIADQVEYDETRLFIGEAISLYAKIHADALKNNKDLAEHTIWHLNETKRLIDTLAKPNDVGAAALDIVGHMNAFAGGAGPELTAAQHLDEIAKILDQAVAKYKAGAVKEAIKMVEDAYIMHFEPVEPALKEKDAAFMTRLEGDIATSLRDLMKKGAPASEVEAKVKEIKAELEQAKALLASGGTTQTVIQREVDFAVIAVLASIIALLTLMVLLLASRLQRGAGRGGTGPKNAASRLAADLEERGGEKDEK